MSKQTGELPEPDSPTLQSRFAGLGAGRFHYLTTGPKDGPLMLLLHGFPEFGAAWADLAGHLPGFRLVAPDQRGYGQSPAPDDIGAYATGRLAGDMAELIAHLGGGPVILVGHDWGASVAYALAIGRPDLVSGLVIMNGVHPVPFQRAMAAGGAQSKASQYINFLRQSSSEDILAADDFAGLLRLFSAGMDLNWLTADRLAAYKAEWARPGRLRSMINWYRASPLVVADPGQPCVDLPELDPARLRVTMPHLLIWGEADTALLPVSTRGLEEFAPDLTRATVAGADHWLHHQRPKAVAAIMLDWLKGR